MSIATQLKRLANLQLNHIVFPDRKEVQDEYYKSLEDILLDQSLSKITIKEIFSKHLNDEASCVQFSLSIKIYNIEKIWRLYKNVNPIVNHKGSSIQQRATSPQLHDRYRVENIKKHKGSSIQQRAASRQTHDRYRVKNIENHESLSLQQVAVSPVKHKNRCLIRTSPTSAIEIYDPKYRLTKRTLRITIPPNKIKSSSSRAVSINSGINDYTLHCIYHLMHLLVIESKSSGDAIPEGIKNIKCLKGKTCTFTHIEKYPLPSQKKLVSLIKQTLNKMSPTAKAPILKKQQFRYFLEFIKS